MSNVSLIIEERAATIGSFMVGRLLPFRQKRAVGPFVFIDHMGPVQLSTYENFDVGPHPHIGLSTLTYLFEGSIMHRDTVGSEIEIQPGAVNWMTAGKGVVHSERTPEYLRTSEKSLHGLQIWVALPKDLESCDPYFSHHPADQIPTWSEDGCLFKLIAGSILGHQSPVPVHSPLYMIEIHAQQDSEVNIGKDLFGESGLYILEGNIHNEGHSYGPRQILIANEASLCGFSISKGTTIYIFGGEPFPEERFIHWNFVASDKQMIEKAKHDWINGRFPVIPNESEPVPYPG